MKLYKLTNHKNVTGLMAGAKETKWGAGITHSVSGVGELCGSGWLHAYTSPFLAVILNGGHAGFKHPRLWEAHGAVGKRDHGLKVGVAKLTTVKRMRLPRNTQGQRVRFAVLCAQRTSRHKRFQTWAKNWLSGRDRTKESAGRIYNHMNYSGCTTAYAAARAALYLLEKAGDQFVRDAVANAVISAAYSAKVKLPSLAKKAFEDEEKLNQRRRARK